MLPTKYRSTGGLLIAIFFAGSGSLVGLFSYFFKDWRTLTKMAGLSGLPVIYYYFMPESPIFYFSQGKLDQTAEIFYTFGQKNKVEKLSQLKIHKMLESIQSQQMKTASMTEQKRTVLDLFRNGPSMRKITIKFIMIWFACTSTYYGLTLNAGELPWSVYKTILVYSIVDVLGKLLAIKLMDHEKIGRRRVMTVSLVLSGVCCFLGGYLTDSDPDFYQNQILWSNFVGRFCISAAYGVIYPYTAELYPTLIRGNGVSLGATFGTFGAVLSKSFISLKVYGNIVPGLVFASMAGLAGILSSTLPETRGQPTANTFEEIEKIYRQA